jgi:hypothetical protein
MSERLVRPALRDPHLELVVEGHEADGARAQHALEPQLPLGDGQVALMGVDDVVPIRDALDRARRDGPERPPDQAADPRPRRLGKGVVERERVDDVPLPAELVGEVHLDRRAAQPPVQRQVVHHQDPQRCRQRPGTVPVRPMSTRALFRPRRALDGRSRRRPG